MPSGLRTPVASISVRVWIGIHQTFGMPGKCSFSSMSLMRSSQVTPLRHSARGFSTTVTSAMPSGAGSVAVSARPSLPNTLTTSGNFLSSRSIAWSSTDGLVFGHAGRRRRHVEEHALVQRRHELALEPEDRGHREHHREQGESDHFPSMVDYQAHDGGIGGHEPAIDRVLLFVVHLAADEEHGERRRERDREDRRKADRVGLRERERLEEPALGRLEREHRQERDR